MYKKISAAFIIMLFALSVVAMPVQAHFTLGNYTGTYDYHTNDFDGAENAHLEGLTGYVFPGAGPLTSPVPGLISPIAGLGLQGYPGYQSLYPGGNPTGANQMWLQADANAYAPFGAILTSTIKAGTAFNRLFLNGNPTIWGPNDNDVDALAIEHAVEGDLVFAFNYTLPATGFAGVNTGRGYMFNRFEIWVPPEFQGIKKENIVVSFTNSWSNLLSTSKGAVDAEIYPNRFTRVSIGTDTALTGLTTGDVVVFGNQTFGDVWVYIRVNKVTAPTIAGKYFFKMGARLIAPDAATMYGAKSAIDMVWCGVPVNFNTFHSNGVPNFPALIVKGEIDPAYVDGTVRYGGYSGASYYGMPLALPGRVRLVGRAIDPFTLQPTNRPVEARGYYNQTANGHFEVEGVPAGIYDIYASAAGYPEKLIQTGVTILKGQSYHVDCYLTPGVVIQGEVFSKCGTGEVNWQTWQNTPGDSAWQDMKIEIYKVGQVPQSSGVCQVTAETVEGVGCTTATPAVSWSPMIYLATTHHSIPWQYSGLANDAAKAGWGEAIVGFPWPGYGGRTAVGVSSQGVGPQQAWRVLNTQANFKFQFGDKGLYGTPAMFDGHVPQLNATWVDGLPAGQYEIRAFTYGYVQTKADGTTFEHVSINVPAVEWPGDVYVPFDLRLSNYIKKTVHFHDVAGTLAEVGIPGSRDQSRTLYLDLIASDGSMWGWKTSTVIGQSLNADIYVRGIRAQSLATGGGRNYGLEADTYTVRAFMYGYVEQVFEKVTVGLCGSEIAISDHLYRGVMFNVTFYSKDWEHPSMDKPWMYPDEYIYLQIYKDGKQLTGYGWNTNVRAPGNEFRAPNGATFTSNGLGQPYVTTGTVVTTAFRVQAGHWVYNHLGKSWVDATVPATDKTFATLYYEGQEADDNNDADIAMYPQAFESGTYSFVGLTYGYVNQMDPLTRQAKPFQVYATKGGVANIPIKLVVGVQIPLIIRFKNERVFEALRSNSTVRVRVFDDKDLLVGEWYSSSSRNGTGRVVLPTTTNPYGQAGQPVVWDTTGPNNIVKGLPESALPTSTPWRLREILGPGYSFSTDNIHGESVNYVPRGTMMLNITICGLPDPISGGSGTSYNENGFDRAFDVRAWNPGKYGAPGAPYGINGDPWYTGGYYVETEVVPFGRDDVANKNAVLVSNPKMLTSVYEYQNWYPSVAGLLFGESCTIDPRTGKLFTWALGANHIGPYQQRVHVMLPGAHLGGDSSGILELDRLGLARGVVYSYTWCDDWRTTSWVSVVFSGAPGMLTFYTFDGRYEAFVPAGTWKMDVIPWLAGAKAPGYGSQSFTLAVSEGQVGGYNVYLEESGVPVPEFPTAIVVLVSALAAALSILRRRRK